jgi:hypothetical protein
MKRTAVVREQLPQWLAAYNIRTVLDIPCGDYHWFGSMDLDLDRYIGADIVPELVASARDRFTDDRHCFLELDAASSELPHVDAIFCRDMLVHFSGDDVRRTIANFKRSGSTYLITTTYPGRKNRRKITTGQWQPIDLTNFVVAPELLELMKEYSPDEYQGRLSDKCLALWRLADIEAVDPRKSPGEGRNKKAEAVGTPG